MSYLERISRDPDEEGSAKLLLDIDETIAEQINADKKISSVFEPKDRVYAIGKHVVLYRPRATGALLAVFTELLTERLQHQNLIDKKLVRVEFLREELKPYVKFDGNVLGFLSEDGSAWSYSQKNQVLKNEKHGVYNGKRVDFRLSIALSKPDVFVFAAQTRQMGHQAKVLLDALDPRHLHHTSLDTRAVEPKTTIKDSGLFASFMSELVTYIEDGQQSDDLPFFP